MMCLRNGPVKLPRHTGSSRQDRRSLIFNANMNTISFLLLFFFGSPVEEAVRLDGVVAAGEWETAKTASLKDGGAIYFKKEKDVLYVALKGTSKGWAHVYLSHNDSVRVMHASAAL